MHTVRRAAMSDAPRVTDIVRRAYAHYVVRLGKPPAPMNADYGRLIADGTVHVLEDDTTVVGVIVLIPRVGRLDLDNVAVDPDHQHQGHGRRLIAFAEAEARRLGLPEVRLYTNIVMTENLALYTRLGFEETHRAEDDGYRRVFMRKRL